MTISEAVAKMQEIAHAANERLEKYCFNIKIETDYMNSTLKTVENHEKARYITTSMVISADGIEEGDEYCLSIGVAVKGKRVDEKQLNDDAVKFDEMVSEMIAVLEEHEDKVEGLKVLTAKANAEYEKLLAEIEEDQKKNRRIVMIGNIVFIVGILILFAVAILRS